VTELPSAPDGPPPSRLPFATVGPFRPLVADRRGHGPVVVLLHGQPGTAADWTAVVPRLAPDFTVLAVDRPGWGRTGGPAGGFATNAAAVLDLLDRLGQRRAVVVGHSWAGGVALALAQAAPERTAGLVLVASVAPDQPAGRLDRLLAAPTVGDVAVPVAFGVAGRLLSSDAAQRLLGRSSIAGDARTALAALVGARREGLHRGSHLRSGWAFTVEQRAYLGELDALGRRLASLAVPTEVVTGDSDRVVGPDAARHLAGTVPQASLRVVAGAGHLLPLEHPDAIEAAVRAVAARAGLTAGGSAPPGPDRIVGP
jgi:pimeloyl-ACP methyl ester carboxylesterase